MPQPIESTTLVCLFKHYREAIGSVDDLHAAGFPKSVVSLIGDGNKGEMYLYPDDVLTSLGVPRRNLKRLERGLTKGGVIVAVSVQTEDAPQVDGIFTRHSAIQVDEEVVHRG